MKIFFSEFKPNYAKYHFPYQVWLLREEDEDVAKIYGSGFLPVRSLPKVYYLCRSLRVDLSRFEFSSENRRILKKTEAFTSSLTPLAEFDYRPEVQRLCRDYARERLGKDTFPVPAIRSVFTGQVYNQVFTFRNNQEEPVGYAVCFIDDCLLQYAHAFYDLNFLGENLGARMMLEAVSWAKENGKSFAYLGTAYEESSLYKTEFKGVEFFNGFSWSKNMDELKELIRGIGEIGEDEGEYLLKNKKYLANFHEGDLHKLLSTHGVRVNF